jgi:hypothetical protein
MIPAVAIGYTGWDFRHFRHAKTVEMFLTFPICDECGHPIERTDLCVATFVNRVQSWTLVHIRPCGMDQVEREIEELRKLRILEEESARESKILAENP